MSGIGKSMGNEAPRYARWFLVVVISASYPLAGWGERQPNRYKFKAGACADAVLSVLGRELKTVFQRRNYTIVIIRGRSRAPLPIIKLHFKGKLYEFACENTPAFDVE